MKSVSGVSVETLQVGRKKKQLVCFGGGGSRGEEKPKVFLF